MHTIKFANILLESNPCSVNYPALYCRSTKPVVFDEHLNEWVLHGSGTFDFTTYFNALSVAKLKEYTSAKFFKLHLEVKGASCAIIQTVANQLSADSVKLGGSHVSVPSSDEFQAIDIDIQVHDDTVLAGFVIETSGKVSIANSYYSVAVEQEPKNVELALATTTFKKEEYIEANIELVKREILSANDDMAQHFNMYVVDNGSTLKVSSLSDEHVHIHPNRNVGGAGGFAYGMILAMEQEPKATHILLMDDDVAVSSESLRRTYNLLRIVDEQYSEAFVSGAMLSYGYGDEQWEDTGFMTSKGVCASAKPSLCMSRIEDVIFSEAYHVEYAVEDLDARYAAWWYCCIPVKVIERNGLPLPYFVRYDDAEYGVRCSKPFITMAGICIWHESFHLRYNAAVERYQTTRNGLIAQATTGFSRNSDFMYALKNNFRLELKKFAYDNAELVLDAFEDFLKGPDYYSAPGVAEETFMAAGKNKEKLVPLGELEKEALELGITDFDTERLNRQLIDADEPRSIKQRLEDYITDNNQRIIKTTGSGYAIVPMNGYAYPAGAIRGKEYIIAVDWFNKVGAIRKKDIVRYRKLKNRYKADMKQYKANEEALLNAYANSRDRVTSVSFWKQYLGI